MEEHAKNKDEVILTEITKKLEEKEKKDTERQESLETKLRTYAAVTKENLNPKHAGAATLKTQEMHSIIIKSTGTETSEKILERIRNTVDAKNTGLNVDKIRKAKDQKVVIGLETATTKDPLVVLRDVIKSHTDEDVVSALKNQNRNLFKDLREEEVRAEIKYRRRARNPHTENIILQVSPRVWKILTEARKVHIDLQRVLVQDQSPLMQCSMCLGYGHGRKHCKEADPTCSHCGGSHLKTDCPDHSAGVPPVCVNCRKAKTSPDAHNAFDIECPVRKRWDILPRSPVAYC
ncbi:unnamed protein product [Pieris macdunnoughi]|uniref:Uncharacterized protein n=1 Tax=Pieris macdunnoughi TaxID=345717 RepID=A0A821XUM6_9NEOP|nr:unnamed protein product [Pieris macdunnoughi]